MKNQNSLIFRKGWLFATLWALSLCLFAQNISVRGMVTDAQKEPLIGVSVKIAGSGTGTVTDINGVFTLANVSPQANLEISYVGMKTEIVAVNGRTTIDIVLGDDTELLDEVVIVGYGTARRRDLTGSIASLRPGSDNAAIASSFDDLLKGKIAGVNVVSAGSTPGAAGSIIIRGANSLTGDSQPLYVIDNVPQASTGQTMRGASGDYQMVQDPLAGINPNDIEDIQVLKDASATAIYGSRGANGVILITTKKGRTGRPTITAGANMTIANAVNLPKLMNLKEYAAFHKMVLPNDNHFSIEGNDVFYTYQYQDESGVDQTAVEKIDYRDWQREALRTAVSSDYLLNISGGSDRVRYNFSSSFKDVNGIVAGTGLKHGDMRLNLNTDLTDKLTFNVNVNGFIRRNNMMSGGNTVGRVSGSLISTSVSAAPYLQPTRDVLYQQQEDKTTVMSWITDYDDITNSHRFSVAADARYQITPNLSYTLRAGGNLANTERDNWYGMQLFRGQNNNGFLSQNRLQNSNYNVENLLNYNQTFGSFRLDATAAVTYDAYKWLNTSLTAIDFPLYTLRTKGLHIANKVTVDNPIQKDYQLMSYLGRVNLSFLNGRYVLTGSLRADGTSKFSKGNRWSYFPSFAAAWNIMDESFMKQADWLSQLKLRVGYGVTGSQNIDPYTTIFLYTSGAGYADTAGSVIQGMQVEVNNPLLKWETTSSVNGGLDFGILDGRVTASVDVYSKTTKDLLLNITLPGSTSFKTLTVNNGSVSNKGVEIGLNADVIRSRGFTWYVGGNIGFNKSRIEKLGVPEGEFGSLGTLKAFYGNTAGDHFGAPNIFIEGKAPGLFYGFKTDGIVQEGDEYNVTAPFTNSAAPGNLKVVDVSGNGTVGLEDKTIIGDPNPDFTYGFETGLTYKGIRFKTSFSGVKGGDIFNANKRYMGLAMYQNGTRNMLAEPALNSWTAENKSNLYPSVSGNIANGHVYDRYIEDGSYLRCTDITLGYTLPSSTVKSVGLSNIDTFISVKDAFTITKYSGYDPTSRSFAFDPLRRGFDLWSFPAQRVFIIGFNLTF